MKRSTDQLFHKLVDKFSLETKMKYISVIMKDELTSKNHNSIILKTLSSS